MQILSTHAVLVVAIRARHEHFVLSMNIKYSTQLYIIYVIYALRLARQVAHESPGAILYCLAIYSGHNLCFIFARSRFCASAVNRTKRRVWRCFCCAIFCCLPYRCCRWCRWLAISMSISCNLLNLQTETREAWR